jgi:hypothetical protein
MITISEDKQSDMFKFRAQVETRDGKRVHLVLPQVENFLYKIDLAQREMGKTPQEFVPVKYANQTSQDSNRMMNYLVFGLFAAIFIKLYRGFHGKGGSGTSANSGSS